MFIHHYDKAAVISNIAATKKRLQELEEELEHWEKKDNPQWKPAPSLEERVAENLF